jgi:hypothetical protein
MTAFAASDANCNFLQLVALRKTRVSVYVAEREC